MRRRDFIAVIGGVIGWPLEASAQQREKVYRVGILDTTSATQNAANLDALREGFRELGYVEGQNLVLEYRSADGRAERFQDLASELIDLKVDLIVTRGTPAVLAVQKASGTIPVVMAAMSSPLNVVASIRRPGGNVTGMTAFDEEVMGKRIELLKELAPNISLLALLHNIGNPMGPPDWEAAKAAAQALGLQVILLDVRNEDDLPRALHEATQRHVDVLLVGADGLTQVHQKMIVDFAANNRLPASYPSRTFVEIGGLMAYAVNFPNLYFRAAGFADKIFRGARPADLPIEQPTKLELVINLKAAKALSLEVAPTLLARADEVIE
jgi:ABC-type uncharacterized transport system substrate-binding protein